MKPAPSMALLLLALLAGGASAARLPGGSREMLDTSSRKQFQYTTFPFSKCTVVSKNSPYRLDVVSRASSMDMKGTVTESVTFQLVHFGLSDYDLEDTCYDALQEDLHTIGFKTRKACEGPVTATINGTTVYGQWQHTRFGSIVKFSNLNLGRADDMQITVELAGQCNTMELFFGSQVQSTFMNTPQQLLQCCPISRLDYLAEEANERETAASYTPAKPPTPNAPKYPTPRSPKSPQYPAPRTPRSPAKPPAPRAPKYPAPRAPKYYTARTSDATAMPLPPFPYYKCQRTTKYGGYRLRFLSQDYSAGVTTWSLQIQTQPGTTWPLYKIEAPIRPSARGALFDFTVDGVPKARSEAKVDIDTNGDGKVDTSKYIVKLTPLRLSPKEAHGKIIRFSAKGEYQTLDDIFEVPVYSAFSDNSSKAYCPTYTL